jgi:hypothetical protein
LAILSLNRNRRNYDEQSREATAPCRGSGGVLERETEHDQGLAAEKTIARVLVGTRAVRIPLDALESLVADNTIPAREVRR